VLGLSHLLLGPQGRQSSVSPIGLEFADERLNVVQLFAGHPPSITAHASVPYTVARAELLRSVTAARSIIKQALRAASFTGRKIVTVLPSSDVRILSLSYQLKAGDTDEQTIGRLVQERVASNLAELVIDYVPVRGESQGGERRALVFVSERRTVIGYLDLLRKTGLDVEALEVGPVAIRRLVSTLIDEKELPQNVLVINAGLDKTYLTIVSGQRLLLDQEVAFGEKALLEEVGATLDVTIDVARSIVFRHGVHPHEKARAHSQDVDDTASMNTVLTILRPRFATLVREIDRAAMFASSETRGARVGRAFLTGSIARWPGADALLSSLVDIPVMIPKPLPIAGEADSAMAPHPDLVVAAGLALRGLVTHA
jgi:type IV pilus assembly protein PilM